MDAAKGCKGAAISRDQEQLESDHHSQSRYCLMFSEQASTINGVLCGLCVCVEETRE